MVETPDNKISNACLENANPWSSYGSSDNAWVSDTGHSGTHSLKVVNNGNNSGWSYPEIEINPPTKTITFGGWNKAQNIESGALNALDFKVTFDDGNYTWYHADFHFPTGTHDWEHREITKTFDKNVIKIKPYVLLYYKTGTAWFDDIYVKPTSEGNQTATSPVCIESLGYGQSGGLISQCFNADGIFQGGPGCEQFAKLRNLSNQVIFVTGIHVDYSQYLGQLNGLCRLDQNDSNQNCNVSANSQVANYGTSSPFDFSQYGTHKLSLGVVVSALHSSPFDGNMTIDYMSNGMPHYNVPVERCQVEPPESSKDLCYDSIEHSGVFCFSMGTFFSGGIGCKTTINLRNQGGSSLYSPTVDLVTDKLFGGHMIDDCGADDHSGNCADNDVMDMGFMGMSGMGMGRGIHYEPMPDFSQDGNHSIYTQSLMSMDLFTKTTLMGTYVKDGRLYRGEIKACRAEPKGAYRDFILRKQIIAPGNMITIGNTILVVPENTTNCDNYTNGPYRSNTPDETNANFTLCPYKVDGVHPSTSAEASTGMGSNQIRPGSQLLWAGLYWQSIVKNENQSQIFNQTILLKNGSDPYEEVVPQVLDYMPNAGKDGYTSYSAFADVTQILQDHDWLSGTYTVANIPVEDHNIPNLGQYGAWTLVLIYRNDEMKMRSFSVFDGWKKVAGNTGDPADASVEIPISGFYTPKSAPINSKVSVFTAEGDRYIYGDYLKALDIDSNQYVDLNYTQRQTFNSSIYPTSMVRVPDPSNNQGIDIQTFDIGTSGENLLKPQQSNITFKFTTKTSGHDRDTYFPSLITFNTDLYTPDVCYDYTYGQHGTYITVPDLTDFNIEGRFDESSPLNVKFFIQNRENSDVTLYHLNFNVDDINTSYASYRPESTYRKKMEGSYEHVPDEDREVSAAYDRNIPIGDLGGLDYFYIYYSMDINTSHPQPFSLPLNVNIDYDLVLENNGHTFYLGHQTTPIGEMNPCQPEPTYKPIYGAFNIVHKGMRRTDNHDPYYYYNLPTQVVGRMGNFLLESMKTGSEENLSQTAPNHTAYVAGVEVLDASGFHYANANCLDPNATTASAGRVWTVIDSGEYAHDISRTDMNSSRFFNRAVQNAAFRISYAVDGNGSIVTLEKLNNGRYKLPSYAQEQCTSCGDDNGIDATQIANCMECLYGTNRETLCSRDNFAIRPESYEMRIYDLNQSDTNQSSFIAGNTPAPTDLNLVSGYSYRIDINATDHRDNGPTPGYYVWDVNTSLIWSPGTHTVSGCNDDANLSYTVYMRNGKASRQIQATNVGRYALHIRDELWTIVDSNSSFMQHHQNTYFRRGLDCLANSNAVQRSNIFNTLNGCFIETNHTNPDTHTTLTDFNTTFYPYRFDLSTLTFGARPGDDTTTPTFVYRHTLDPTSDDNMSYNIYGTFSAVGFNANPLSNFVDNCYAEDVNLTLKMTFLSPQPSERIRYDLFDNNVSGYIRQNALINPNDPLTQRAADFAPNMDGSISMDLGFNYDREINATRNPVYIQMDEINASLATSPSPLYVDGSSTHQITGRKSIDQNISFIFVQAKPDHYVYETTQNSIKTPISIVAYCDLNLTECQNRGLSSIATGLLSDTATNEAQWWIVQKHNSSQDGNITLSAQNGSVAPASPSAPVFTQGVANQVTVSGTAPNIVDIDLSTATPWLVYNPDSNTTPSPYYRVRFLGTGNWSTTGNLPGVGNVVGGQINKKKIRRLEW